MEKKLKALLYEIALDKWNQEKQPELVAKIKDCLDRDECGNQDILDIIDGLRKGKGMIQDEIRTLEMDRH